MEGSVSVLWWEEVHLCRCSFFFFLRKDEVREKGRKSKGKRKDPRHGTKHPPKPKSPYDGVARLSY